jgi:molecular chaperone HtpG
MMSGTDSSGHDPFGSDAILRVLHLSPEQVAVADYADAYRQISDGWPEPLETIHRDDSVLTRHQAVLFIPGRAAPDLYESGFAPSFRLYLNQTLVDESAGEMLPRWLRWVHGAVHSSNLPDETLRIRAHRERHLRLIRRSLTSQVIDALGRMQKRDRARYELLWRQVGQAVKEGVLEGDDTNREARLGLLLFSSSRGADSLTTLGEYVERMREDQREIWYLAGGSRPEIEESPALKGFRDQGLEVLYFTDPLDERMVEALVEFEGKPLRSAERVALSLGRLGVDQGNAPEGDAMFLARLKGLLGRAVSQVQLSMDDGGGPAVLVGGRKDPHWPNRGGVLRLNAGHPLVQRLRRRFDADPADPLVGEYAHVLLGLSLMKRGFDVPNRASFIALVTQMMEDRLEAA